MYGSLGVSVEFFIRVGKPNFSSCSVGFGRILPLKLCICKSVALRLIKTKLFYMLA